MALHRVPAVRRGGGRLRVAGLAPVGTTALALVVAAWKANETLWRQRLTSAGFDVVEAGTRLGHEARNDRTPIRQMRGRPDA